MTTYLIGTDGTAASDAIADHLAGELDAGDHLEVVHVLTTDEVDDRHEGEAALERLAERLGGQVSVETQQLARGREPAAELVEHAEAVGADHVVTALRRHSRTERVIFGSVSHALLQRVTRPLTLVPLPEYTPE
jgi:nucleotide-binding universal stress UspA family protein